MKEFFKYTLATITGFVITLFLIFVLGITFIIGLMATSSSETLVAEHSVLHLRLSGELSERAVDNPLKDFLPNEASSVGLRDVLQAIKKAKENDNIEGIYLEAGSLAASFASLEAIRNALLDFKSSEKFIISYGDQYTQGQYYLASVADEIYLNPQGAINWVGLATQPIFYTDLLKKIGVEMQIFKVGTYKSAVEPYTETKMSDASREQTKVFLNDIWSHIVENVSASRQISEENLQEYADKMMLFQPAQLSLDVKLVDKLAYKSEMDSILKVKLDDEKPVLLSYKKMKNVVNPSNPRTNIEGSIAVYYAEGAIVDFSSKYETEIVANKVLKDLKKLEDNEDIKAVVLRVNSPGGSAFASEQIWKAVMDLKAKKPVVVSMGDYAASGGYYISAAADYILAEPTTLTGSIGIFAMIPDVKKLTETVGLDFDVVKTNKMSDFGAIYRNFNPDERVLLQNYVESGYDLFVKRCAEGRSMSDEAIREIAEGRVWTGARAKELGLVDELGGLSQAISIAASKAGITEYRERSFPAQPSFMEQLLDMTSSDAVISKLYFSKYTDVLKQAEEIKRMTESSSLQARMPYVFNFSF